MSSISFVFLCFRVCLWKHVTDLTRMRQDEPQNQLPTAHHSSFTLHEVIVHHPQNTKGARPFAILCKVEMKARLQPVLVGPSLAVTTTLLAESGLKWWSDLNFWNLSKTLNLLCTVDLCGPNFNGHRSRHLRLGVRRILGIAEPSRIGLADLGLDQMTMTCDWCRWLPRRKLNGAARRDFAKRVSSWNSFCAK